MIHLVTFSDESMSRSRELCISSFKRHSESLLIHYSTPEAMKQSEFYRQNKVLLDQPRGCGFWAWKPYIIHSVLTDAYEEGFRRIPDGHYLIYADAGVEFINNVSHIIDRMDQDIFLFGNNWEHAHWCKRDVIDEIWAGGWERLPITDIVRSDAQTDDYDRRIPWHYFGKQVQASVIFFRVSDYTRAFVKEWLDWCLFEGGRLIDDSPSRLPNHPEFQEHRHDQAILTTMAYREGIKLHWWPAIYNDGAFTYEKLPCYAGDDYPILFHHHRRRNNEWSNAA